MRLTSKCLVVALSALFAATPAVPVGAMPLPTVKVQSNEASTDTQLVDHRRYLRRKWYRDRAYDDVPRSYGHGSQSNRHDGRRYYRPYRSYHHRNRDALVPLGILGMGAIIGGAIASERAYSGGGSHVSWCANRYRSYRAYDNTYQPYGGPRRQCYSPYR